MSDQYAPEDSATLFIPPELYQRMLVSKPRGAGTEDGARVARTASGAHAAPESVTSADRPDSATLFYRGASDESTLASARDVPSRLASREARVQIEDPGTEDVDAGALEPEPVAMSMPAVAAPHAEPRLAPNGTIMMDAFPYLVGQPPAAPPPPTPTPTPTEEAGADSARVRRALDEMSMLIDVNAMPGKLASASDDELERYVEALRRSEGLPEASAAPRTPVPPPYGNPVPLIPLPHEAGWHAAGAPYANQYPGQVAPPAYGTPQPVAQPGAPMHEGQFALPPGFVRNDVMLVAAPIAPPSQARRTLVSPMPVPKKPAKRGGAGTTALFAVMFLVTLVGVGAVTYVALRSGDAAAAGAVTTSRH